jgi:hypothetical protein
MNEKQAIYDELCRVLTDYEGKGSRPKATADDLYTMLMKIQNNWESVITVSGSDNSSANDSSDSCKIPIPYISVWDGGVEIETTAIVDIRTGEVTDVISVDVTGLDLCEREYIVMNSEQVDVYQDEHGFDLWADIENEYGG